MKSNRPRCRLRVVHVAGGTRRSAFTLVEAIMALSLAGVLMVGVYAAIDQSWKTSSSGREEMERAQIARALVHRIETDVRAITYQPPPPVEDETTSTTTTTTTSSGSNASGIAASGSNTSSGSSGSGGSGSSSSGSKSSGSSGTGSGSSTGGGSSGSKSGSGSSGSGSTSKSGSGSSGSSGSGGSSGSSSGGSNSSNFTGTAGTPSSSGSAATAEVEPLPPNSKPIGIRGTHQQMEMSIIRARRDLLPGNATTAAMGGTSDLREVTYTFLASGSPATSGLVRTEGDRMAVEVVEAGGGQATQISNHQMLAPEVASISFRYFDGKVWAETWDSDKVGRVPRAVEVVVTFQPLRRKPSVFQSGLSHSMDSFRTVIVIPVSDPYPKELVQ